MSTNNKTPQQRRDEALEKLLKDPNLKPSDREFFRAAYMMQNYVEHMVENAERDHKRSLKN